MRLAASLLAGSALAAPGSAYAQVASERTFSVPAGRLGDALATFGRQAGLQLAYRPNLATGRTTAGLSGSATPDAALRRLLAGTGLSYQLTSARTAVITGPAEAAAADVPTADGSLVLDAIKVTGAGGVAPADAPYQTPAPTAHISRETIERFRGSSPADIFRGTPGVMSGEARNGAGSIDVNIRGMQGMGRVAVTVDGAENALQVYQGYQGISNRSFVDPDLLAGVDIQKGSDAASSGIAGTVAMRTLEASDIIQEGRDYGLRFKGGVGTNSSKPHSGDAAGYDIRNNLGGFPTVTASPTGMDRPGLLDPTNGSGSGVFALSRENFDVLGGFAYRKRGNYHAGEHGSAAKVANTGRRPFCYPSGVCIPAFDYMDYAENQGLTNYRAGEEVLNTELETLSFIGKGTLRFGDGHSVQLGYTGFRSEAGDLFASNLSGVSQRSVQKAQTAGTELDSGTMRYRWKPADNDLIDLKANVWVTNLELRNPRRALVFFPTPESLGLRANFRTGSDTVMWGADASNTSHFELAWGDLDLTYGASFKSEDTKPSKFTPELEQWLDYRDAVREEAAAFTKAAWKPTDWLTLNAGLRYSHFWTQDRNEPQPNWVRPDYIYDLKRNEGGFSPSLRVTVEPIKGAQIYANYSSALRAPSLFESVSAFTIAVNPDVKPERSHNWEIGANLVRADALSTGDNLSAKFGYFNWYVDDYISREYIVDTNGISRLRINNIDSARFSGLEFSGRYEIGGFKSELTANYYLNVEFCRTADTCSGRSLYSDYATNQVPPEYSISLTASQQVTEALTLGGRLSRIGPRAIKHGDATAQGLQQFIAMVNWKPYTLVDAFAEYKIKENLTAAFRVENLTDRYYVDPLSLVAQPAPGRTFYASMTAQF